MRLRIEIMLPLWIGSFVMCAATLTTLGWMFFVSLAVFSLCTWHIERHQKAYDGDLDDWFNRMGK